MQHALTQAISRIIYLDYQGINNNADQKNTMIIDCKTANVSGSRIMVKTHEGEHAQCCDHSTRKICCQL
jgi:hypothetical protein